MRYQNGKLNMFLGLKSSGMIVRRECCIVECRWVRYPSNIQCIACVINVDVSIYHGDGLTPSVLLCLCCHAEPRSFYNFTIWQEILNKTNRKFIKELCILLLSAYCSNKKNCQIRDGEREIERGRKTFSFIHLDGMCPSKNASECLENWIWNTNTEYYTQKTSISKHSPDLFVWNMKFLSANANTSSTQYGPPAISINTEDKWARRQKMPIKLIFKHFPVVFFLIYLSLQLKNVHFVVFFEEKHHSLELHNFFLCLFK